MDTKNFSSFSRGDDQQRRLQRLAVKEDFRQKRDRICREQGVTIKPFACLVCGHDIDSYTIQCDECGHIYTAIEIVFAGSAGAMRRAGATEEEILAAQQIIFGNAFRHTPQKPTPLIDAHLAQPASGAKN